MNTLTLSKVEQAAVVRHLEVQRAHADRKDQPTVDALIIKIRSATTVVLARLEVFVMLRSLRAQSLRMTTDMEALEERRLRGGVDGTLDEAHRLLDVDNMILGDVIRRLWDII